MIGSTISLGIFMVSLLSEKLGIVLPPILLIGFFIVPSIPTLLEFSCESNFPIGEGTISGFIYAVAHITGGFGGMGLTALVHPEETLPDSELRHRVFIGIAIILGLFLIGIVLMFFTKEKLKRLKAEKERKYEKDKDTDRPDMVDAIESEKEEN